MQIKRLWLLVSSAACAFSAATTVAAQSWKPTGPALSVEAMSRDWVVWGARISPDGKHIAALAGIPGQNPVVRVWETDNMSKAPVQFGSRSMRFYSISFINNSRLFVNANQPVEAGAYSDWASKAVLANLDGSSFTEIGETEAATSREDDRIIGYSVFRRLPKDEGHFLLQVSRFNGREISKVNIANGRKNRVARAGENESILLADSDGNIEVKSEVTTSGGVYTQRFYFRPPNGTFKELPALSYPLNDRNSLSVVKVSNDKKSIWVLTNQNSNFVQLKRYDIETDTLSDTVAQNTEFDLSSIDFGSASDQDAVDNDNLRTICWSGPVEECIYNDPLDKRISSLLERALPGRSLSFVVRGNGANIMVTATAPNVPTTYYLLKNERQLIKVGSNIDGWDQTNLGPAEWISYKARDGFDIPGILTLPPNYKKERDGAIPLVVMPHGGPWSRDDMEFDVAYWTQMFATRGFAVLQPQYRGSQGLGKALWKGGDRQWGLIMQDDKDDGARSLVAQGIADPNRMMIYGYSYGGFAAAAAATRSSGPSQGLWQCAISGAPAVDLERIQNDWGEDRFSRIMQGNTVAGFDPYENLDKVKIPWLIFHGSYDRQADTIHSRTTAARMKQVNPTADFRYIEIPKMSHTLNKWTPEMRTQSLTAILDWTSNNCGNISATFKEPGLKTTPTRRASR